MAMFRGLSFRTLHERLGAPDQKSFTSGGDRSHLFHMFWFCVAGEAACVARIKADDRPMPKGLDAREQEFFEHAPFPKEGWTLNACEKHRDLFRDHPEESE